MVVECGASFRSPSHAGADAATPHGRPMPTVLDGLTDFEREVIRARTMEGREGVRRAHGA